MDKVKTRSAKEMTYNNSSSSSRKFFILLLSIGIAIVALLVLAASNRTLTDTVEKDLLFSLDTELFMSLHGI